MKTKTENIEINNGKIAIQTQQITSNIPTISTNETTLS